MIMPPQQQREPQREPPRSPQAPFGRSRTTEVHSRRAGGGGAGRGAPFGRSQTQEIQQGGLPGLSRRGTSTGIRERGRARTSVKLGQLLESESRSRHGSAVGPSGPSAGVYGPGKDLVRLDSNASLVSESSLLRSSSTASAGGGRDSSPNKRAVNPGPSTLAGLSGHSLAGQHSFALPSTHHNPTSNLLPASLYGTRRSQDTLEDFEDSQSSFFDFDPGVDLNNAEHQQQQQQYQQYSHHHHNNRPQRSSSPRSAANHHNNPSALGLGSGHRSSTRGLGGGLGASSHRGLGGGGGLGRPSHHRVSSTGGGSSGLGIGPISSHGGGGGPSSSLSGGQNYMQRRESRKTLEELSVMAQCQGNAVNEETFEMEIAPGHYVPFRNANEVWRAVDRGTTLECMCLECGIELVCVADCEHVLCPDCNMVNPIFDRPPIQNTPYGAGIGLKKEWLIEQGKY